MKYSDIDKLSKLILMGKKELGVGHSKYYEIHKAGNDLEHYAESYIIVERASAVAEHIESKISENDSEKLRGELKKKQDIIASYNKKLDGLAIIEKDIKAAIAEVRLIKIASDKGAKNPDVIGLMVNHDLKSNVGDDGEVEFYTKDGQSIESAIEALKVNPKYSNLFGEAQNRANIGTANTINPWKKETFNLSKQGEILRNDRKLAERLKREAEETNVRRKRS